MNIRTPEKSFDLIVGIDRSDATVAICTLQPSTGEACEVEISSSPESLHQWRNQLRGSAPDAHVAVAFEQPAPNLIAFFAAKTGVTLYGLNPSATWAHRQSLVVSRARTDQTDARDIAYMGGRKLEAFRVGQGLRSIPSKAKQTLQHHRPNAGRQMDPHPLEMLAGMDALR